MVGSWCLHSEVLYAASAWAHTWLVSRRHQGEPAGSRARAETTDTSRPVGAQQLSAQAQIDCCHSGNASPVWSNHIKPTVTTSSVIPGVVTLPVAFTSSRHASRRDGLHSPRFACRVEVLRLSIARSTYAEPCVASVSGWSI